MEGFNDLLLKLRDVHEREVEGWQVKVQELSNKKGCDTKRMEELFTRNQQMKEQQRLLTENIKTLENRLRAGLCDRCSVTQEVANRRQQEYEASQIQSLQHISRMVGEMNHMKKENKRLRDEIGNLRAALEGHSDHSSNSSNIKEVKPNSSPDLSPSSGPVALITVATSTANNQPSDGNVGVKTETDQRTEEAEHRQLTGMNRGSFESYKPLSLSTLASPSWRTEHGVPRAGERRAQSIEGLDQRSSIPPSIPLQNSSSITGEEVNATRHVLHTPVPCRPHPIKSSSVTLPWPLSESSDWVSVAAAGTSQGMHPTSKPNLPRFPNLIPTSLHASPRRQVFGSPWPKHSTSQALLKEPTLVFRLRSLSEHVENQIKPQEKKETQLTKAERVSAEGLREMYEGPLDLSERGKYKSSQTAKDNSTLVIQGGERVHKSPDKDVTGNTSTCIPVSSPSPVIPLSSSSSPPVKQQEEEPISDHNQKQAIKDQEQKDEVNGKTEQNNEKKVPVLTISLRPVVVLETLNSALQKQDALSSNGKSLPTIEPGSSSEEQVEEESVSSQERSQGCKRKRTSAEREADRDSDTDNIEHERNIKITVGTEEEEP